MYHNFFILGLLCIIFQTNCFAQNPSSKKRPENYPCFSVRHPNIIYVSDSFELKKNNFFAIFSIYCNYDSLGKIKNFKPFILYIKSLESGKTIKQYYYTYNKGVNMCESEAKKYFDWAVQSLPSVTSIIRRVDDLMCDSVGNGNTINIEYRIE